MATNARELLQKIAKQKEDTQAIQALWSSLFPEFPVADARQCQVWLRLYSFEQVVEGLEIANFKLHRRTNETLPQPSPYGDMDRTQAIKYASGAMKGLKKQVQQ
jgi:hypothetical protein